MNTMLQFLRDMFSGTAAVSFGRCASGLIIVFVLGWDTAYIIWHHTPVSATELLGQATFFMSPYVATKVNETIQASKGNGK